MLVQNVDQEYGMSDITFPDTCSIGTGAKITISAMTFWAASAVASFMTRKAQLQAMEAEAQASLTEPLAP